jgi:DnaK suppressor protein
MLESMSDVDDRNELTADEVAELKRSLLKLQDELQQFIASTREGTRPVELDEPIGRLTRMDAIQQQSVAKAARRSHDLRLRQVQQALKFMERDRFGLCGRCEEPIGFKRLSARPESPYCLECQGDVDQRNA